ncbi:MAG: exonuclease domain-containing protein [Desulfobacteraceae bacterium]
MRQINKFWCFTLLASLVTMGAVAFTLFTVWEKLTPKQAEMIFCVFQEYAGFFFIACFLVLGVIGLGLDAIFNIYILPVKKILTETAVMYTSNPSHRLQPEGRGDLAELALVINNFAGKFENLKNNVTRQIHSAKKETENEKNLLAAVMDEIAEGVLIFNRSGRILLYNSQAGRLFSRPAQGGGADVVTRKEFIGLGRSIFHFLDKNVITRAVNEVEERLKGEMDHAASSFTAVLHNHCMLNFEIIPVIDRRKSITGFVLTFTDITEKAGLYCRLHASLAQLQQSLVPCTDQQEHPGNGSIHGQFAAMKEEILDSVAIELPLTRLSMADLLSALQREAALQYDIRLFVQGEGSGKTGVLINIFSFTSAFLFTAQGVAALTGARRLFLTCSCEELTVSLDLEWENSRVTMDELGRIMARDSSLFLPLPYILEKNRAELSFLPGNNSICSRIRFTISLDRGVEWNQGKRAPVFADSRPEFYDFDLFQADDGNVDLLEKNLDDISYTVFDTETTGLDPAGGDEIISIGAVRIVNRRIQYQETFETLVDPGRDIPADSFKIHGISHRMVKGKPVIEDVLPQFHKFVGNTVLLGHNIAFDMKMLRIKEEAAGIRFFKAPVLDTLLLSAVLYPAHGRHDLETIARRLGVDIMGRHTSLGDAIAAAEIFIKTIPVLQERGIFTLKQALEASKKTYYARLKY